MFALRKGQFYTVREGENVRLIRVKTVHRTGHWDATFDVPRFTGNAVDEAATKFETPLLLRNGSLYYPDATIPAYTYQAEWRPVTAEEAPAEAAAIIEHEHERYLALCASFA